MKQSLIYSALFAFALSAAAPVAMAGDDHDKHQDEDRRTMDSGTYDAGDYGTDDERNPTDPRHPSNNDGTGSGTGTGTGGAGSGGAGTGAGAGTGTGG